MPNFFKRSTKPTKISHRGVNLAPGTSNTSYATVCTGTKQMYSLLYSMLDKRLATTQDNALLEIFIKTAVVNKYM